MGAESTLAELLAARTGVRVTCTACRTYRDVDLARLIAIKGGTYSLYDRRCRCRMTKGCDGWNRFFAMVGFPRKMWSEAT